jgi:hypothetical protein
MTLWLLTTFPAWLLAIVMLGAFMLLGVGGLILVRQSFRPKDREGLHEVAGFIYATIGVCYAVLMAFVVLVVWEQLSAAEANFQEEAGIVRALIEDARAYPGPVSQQLRAQLVTYTRSVIEDEWPAMASGQSSPKTDAALRAIEDTLLGFKPSTVQEQVIFTESFNQINRVIIDRTLRLHQSQAAVPATLWLALIVGAIVTIAFSYFFRVGSVLAQALMTAALALVIASVLFVIVEFDRPFTGDIRVEPTTFEQLLGTVEGGQIAVTPPPAAP